MTHKGMTYVEFLDFVRNNAEYFASHDTKVDVPWEFMDRIIRSLDGLQRRSATISLADHDRRVTELLNANNALVEKNRGLKRDLEVALALADRATATAERLVGGLENADPLVGMRNDLAPVLESNEGDVVAGEDHIAPLHEDGLPPNTLGDQEPEEGGHPSPQSKRSSPEGKEVSNLSDNPSPTSGQNPGEISEGS